MLYNHLIYFSTFQILKSDLKILGYVGCIFIRCFFSFQMKWLALCVLTIVVIALAIAEGEVWEEDDHEVLIRSERGAKNRGETFISVH